MLTFKFYINKIHRKIFVSPEFMDGGPGAYAFGSFQYDPEDNDGSVEYSDYSAALRAELELSLKTIPDIDFTTYSLTIQPWEGDKIVTPPTNPVANDPIDTGKPVPVSSEIRADAYDTE